MHRINWGRVIGGGLLAGVIIDIVEGLVSGMWLAQEWQQVMKRLGLSGAYSGGQVALFNAWGLLMGIAAVWLYASIRPRYGPGPGTALRAGLAVWVIGYLMSVVPPLVMGMFPVRLLLISLAAGLVEVLAGTLLGAWIYKEEPAA